MKPSDNKKPAASSASCPGVRIVRLMGRVSTRISKGSSRANSSACRLGFAPATQRITSGCPIVFTVYRTFILPVHKPKLQCGPSFSHFASGPGMDSLRFLMNEHGAFSALSWVCLGAAVSLAGSGLLAADDPALTLKTFRVAPGLQVDL